MFYDLEDPNKFISDSAKSLLMMEFYCSTNVFKIMIKQNDLGVFHEHIEFYSLKSLKYLFENNGMEIFKIEENV